MSRSAGPPLGRYSLEEVRVLVEEYAALKEKGGRLFILVRLADLKRALRGLPQPELMAVLVVGFLGYTVRDCERILGVKKDTAHRRYKRGLERLKTIMNGGN